MTTTTNATNVFDTEDAFAINKARMDHLESLGFDFDGKTILDAGAGVGHLAAYLDNWGLGSRITCVDARAENIERLRQKYPLIRDARVLDVESFPPSVGGRGWDVVFCYGLLYHLESPLRALTKLVAEARELVLLETIVCDHHQPLVLLADEPAVPNQSLRGVGSRPTPSWVSRVLSRLGLWVYLPQQPPDHPDFKWLQRNDLSTERDGHSIRVVFVGSTKPLSNDRLDFVRGPS